jgi:hypothetical protein
MKSLNQVQSRSLILNQFNFEGWNHEKSHFKKLVKEKNIVKKIGIKFKRKKKLKEDENIKQI